MIIKGEKTSGPQACLKGRFPFRLGTTSFILPAGIPENVRYLAGRVDDVELLVFESDEISPIPTEAEVEELARIAREQDLSYTVHLPLDLWLGSEDEALRRSSVGKVLRVAERMSPLPPFAYICHLHGDGPGPAPSPNPGRWACQCRRSLEEIIRVVEPRQICVETLDYPFSYVDDLVADLGLSVCLDAGHCLLHGFSVEELLDRHGPRIRVLHLHGVAEGKDHRDLSRLDPAVLSGLVSWLRGRQPGSRVLTMEVFRRESFDASCRAMIPFLGD